MLLKTMMRMVMISHHDVDADDDIEHHNAMVTVMKFLSRNAQERDLWHQVVNPEVFSPINYGP